MPPSPVLRCSPGVDLRIKNHHKRGRSLESGLPLKAKDDDLALFNDMQMRERDNFLLCSNDDLDDSLSKLRCFSGFNLDITIPIRGENSDLLNADGEKNDYDWLLTPPDTPLFPSLDDDEPQQVKLASRGRPRSQPISISRSSTMEKSQRTSRSSASPHRLSPSPRSNNNTLQSRGRPSSAPRSSPTPVLRPTTPSRRPSTPPNKPSTPTPRSSTPTIRRMGIGSSGQRSSGRRGASPVKASRVISASPKLHGWQSNLPGFSSDPPPNLRTSLADRPASHIRGLSPASSNGRNSSSKSGRQSMSPTASRSASSSHSHDRDRFSPHSKGSVVSLGDDDGDSLHSVMVGISCSPTGKKNGVFMNGRGMAFSKKASRTSTSSSAPKRSFDSAIRQMDHRKTPQNMFRPLLSSVPATTFYVGKTNTMQRHMFSRNSSITTSSNASSDQGVSVAPDTEGSDHEQNDLDGEWEKSADPNAQEEVFMFDNMDEIGKDIGPDICTEKPQNGKDFDGSMASKLKPVFEKLTASLGDATVTTPASETSHAAGHHSEVGCFEIIATCSKCGKSFHIMEVIDGNTDICQECAEKDALYTIGLPGTTLLVPQNEELHSVLHSEGLTLAIDGSCDELKPEMGELELHRENSIPALAGQHENNVEHGIDGSPDSCPVLVIGEGEQWLPDKQLEVQQAAESTQPDSANKFQQFQTFSSNLSLKVDAPEATGISVLLLKRSSSNKGPFLQGRAFTATSIHCAEPSYARDNVNAMKGSFERESSSASSSIDLGSSKQTEACVQQQLSGRKGDMYNLRNGLNAKSLSYGRSLSGISNNSYEAPICANKTRSEENLDGSAGATQPDALGETVLVTEDHGVSLENTEFSGGPSSAIRTAVPEGDKIDHSDNCRVMDASPSELSSHTQSTHLKDASAIIFVNEKDCVSRADAEGLQHNARSITDIDLPADISDSSIIEEDDARNGSVCGSSTSDAPMHFCSCETIGPENEYDSLKGSETGCEASQNTNNLMLSYHPRSVSTTSDKDLSVSALESDSIHHANCIHEESSVAVEGSGGQKSRSLTLEEATDTILFCSSIIHDLACKAAAIGMEKEQSAPTQVSPPTVSILGKPLPDQKDQRTPSKRTPKSEKVRRKRLETVAKVTSTESGNNVKIQESLTCDAELPNKVDGTKPPKLESKCNCTVM